MASRPSTKRVHDITPDPSLLEDIGIGSFSTAEAISELVANSVDARVITDEAAGASDPVHVSIQVESDTITVLDDARGMTEDELASALRLAAKRAPRQGAWATKSEYGLGLKTACASLGRHWSITTRPANKEEELYVEIDLREWQARAGEKQPNWKVQIETKKRDPSGPLADTPRGTAIVITRLREPDPLPGPIARRLAAAYKPHIERLGDTISVNGVPAVPEPFTLIENSKAEVDVECGNHRITGWVGLTTTTHNTDTYGLNLYRRNQLIEAWNKDWFKAHLMTSRIVGDIELNFVRANFHKKGFAKNTKEWKEAEVAMTAFLQPVVTASRVASRGRNDRTRWLRATQAMQAALGHASDKTIRDLLRPGADAGQDSGEEDEDDVGVEPHLLKLSDENIRLDTRLQDLGEEEVTWSYLFSPDSAELQAVVNTGSAVYTKTKDPELLATLALADSIAQFLIKRRGWDPTRAWAVRDRWLYAATK